MLYATTRNHNNTYTARHSLCKNADNDGGLFVPFQNVVFTEEQISGLTDKSFGQCVAEVLNIFFGTKLCSRDVDLVLGRHPFRFAPMSHKILIVETWVNPHNDFLWMVQQLRNLILPSCEVEDVTEWTMCAVRIATLFGIYAELSKLGVVDLSKAMDIAVSTDDFSTPMSVFYAKKMGLPIGRILFGCSEDSGIWDLMNHGQFRRLGANGIERLIYERLGREEVTLFASCLKNKKVYSVTEEKRILLSKDFFGAVISSFRRRTVVANVFSTNGYCMDENCAVAYGALQDYRAIHGETRPALIMSEHTTIE